MPLSIKYGKLLEKIKARLYKEHGGSGVSLLNEMFVKSEFAESSEYKAKLEKWLLGKSSTLELRELCEPFGDYWAGVNFSNQVDSLDSAQII